MTQHKTITILGINGHIGHHAAAAFVAAGWEVTGFGREHRKPVAGVRFVAGDARNAGDLRAAVAGSEVVLNALNLPYHQWDEGRMEALHAGVIEAMAGGGRTMLFPANIYNYAPTQTLLTPDLAQEPPTPRGAIRVRVERMLEAAARRGELQVLLVRAGDYYGPACEGDWFDQVIFREVGKGKVALPGTPGTGHAWAYLPDLARAFVAVAERCGTLAAFENFHFAGHYVTPAQLAAAIARAAPVRLRVASFPWVLLTLMGLTSPVLREVAKMGYLWRAPMALADARLDALLGPGFGTPFEAAVAATLTRFFPANRHAAA